MLKILLVCNKRYGALSSIINTLLRNIFEAFMLSLRTRSTSRMDSLKLLIKLMSGNNIGHVNVADESSYDSVNSVDNNNDVERIENIVLNALNKAQNCLCIRVMQNNFQLIEHDRKKTHQEKSKRL